MRAVKLLFILTITFIITDLVSSQLKVKSSLAGNSLLTNEMINASATLSENEVKKLINEQFTNLINGQSMYNLGSYASVNISEPTGTISASWLLASKVLNFTASGGVTNKIFSIFNNSDLNSNISLGLQVHFLDAGSRYLEYDAELYREYFLKKEKIENRNSYNKNRYLIDPKLSVLKNQLEQSTNLIRSNINRYKDEIKEIEKKITLNETDKLKITELKLKILDADNSLDSIGKINTIGILFKRKYQKGIH